MRVGDVVWAKQKGYSVRALVCLLFLSTWGARWRCPAGAATYSVLRSCATLRFSPLAPRPSPAPPAARRPPLTRRAAQWWPSIVTYDPDDAVFCRGEANSFHVQFFGHQRPSRAWIASGSMQPWGEGAEHRGQKINPTMQADFARALAEAETTLALPLLKRIARHAPEFGRAEPEEEEEGAAAAEEQKLERGEEKEEEDEEKEDDSEYVCTVCKSTADAESMLLCDGCDDGTHMGCLTPKMTAIPDGSWYCQTCTAARAQCDACRGAHRAHTCGTAGHKAKRVANLPKYVASKARAEVEAAKNTAGAGCYICGAAPRVPLRCSGRCRRVFHRACIGLARTPATFRCDQCVTDADQPKPQQPADTPHSKKRARDWVRTTALPPALAVSLTRPILGCRRRVGMRIWSRSRP